MRKLPTARRLNREARQRAGSVKAIISHGAGSTRTLTDPDVKVTTDDRTARIVVSMREGEKRRLAVALEIPTADLLRQLDASPKRTAADVVAQIDKFRARAARAA